METVFRKSLPPDSRLQELRMASPFFGPPSYGVLHPAEQIKITKNHNGPAHLLQISFGFIPMEDTPASHWLHRTIGDESCSAALQQFSSLS